MSKLSNQGSKQFDDGDFIEKTQIPDTVSKTSALDAIISIESGEYDCLEDMSPMYQVLIDDGIIWHLQGSHQRNAVVLLNLGYCHQDSASSWHPPLSILKTKSLTQYQ